MKIVNDDLLNANEYLILHQVNVHGVMGGGVAACIAEKYPEVLKAYQKHCSKHTEKDLLGTVLFVPTKDNKHLVANLFSQNSKSVNGNFTNYAALSQCLDFIVNWVQSNYHGLPFTTIAAPFKLGCGIAGGDWGFVYSILENFENQLFEIEPKSNFELALYSI